MYELFHSDLAVVIAVIAEHVLHDVVELIGVLVQHLHQKLFDLFLLEHLVAVGVEMGQHFHHPRPHECGKTGVREGEFVVAATGLGSTHYIYRYPTD